VSLIDEALKRAEIEAARRDGLRKGASPWVMESRPRRRRSWLIVLSVMALAAAGGVLWLSRRSSPSDARSQPPAAETQSKIQNPKSKIDMETVEVPPPPAVIKPRDPGRAGGETAVPKTEQPSVRPAAASADAGRARKSEAPRAQPAQAAPAAEPRSSSPPPESKAPRGLASGRTYVGEVSIPDGGKIALEGIVYSETNPVALINGKVLPPGGIVEEFTIASIQPDRVELKGRGITIFVSLK
jgi:hypothetical protein